MEHKKKTLIWEDNNEPPKDYIWIKSDGKAYEFDYLTRKWVESKTVKAASGSNGGSIEGALLYNEQDLTEEQQMQARKNQGLYYEKVSVEEKHADNPSPNNSWMYPDNYFEMDYETFQWICADTPTEDDIISVVYSDESDPTPAEDLVTNTIDELTGVTIYSKNLSDPARKKFLVASQDVSYNGFELKKGIYIPSLQTIAEPYLLSISYRFETEEVHKIPAKYISSETPTVKMYIPSNGLTYYNMGFILLDDYISSRDVVFSADVDGYSLSCLTVYDAVNGSEYCESNDNTCTFDSGGLYYITLELVNNQDNSNIYVCAMVYVYYFTQPK